MNLKKSNISFTNKALRFLWRVVYLIAFRATPVFLHPWRAFVLKLFGARIGSGAHVYPSAKIWAPWNLVMGAGSCLAGNVDCYNVATVTLGEGTTVSQYSYLCTASRDYQDPSLPLMVAPITIGSRAWVAADVYIAPGVNVGEGSVLAARTSIFKDVPIGVLVRQGAHLHTEVIVKKL